MDGAKQNI